ncbi:MAG: Gfo/Idh/MocA family oxidoreductase [Candidatus Brocadiae bacterium]|nr:Gfo/Idh/MocA family oxidoreductase [Candidatus Brocadiia bacterium]
MAAFRVGFIGTGKDPSKPGRTGFAMAYQHGSGYRALGGKCEMVACADLVQERADAFAAQFGLARTYTDYNEMLAKEHLDIVSICTWPHLHARMVVDCAEAGVPAIHCEKPMALTWGDSRRMAEVCAQAGAKLTFNHQRRFGKPFRKAKGLLDAGEVGKLVKIESGMGNLYDYGSHNFDMCGYFNDQAPCEWVIAQIDYHRESMVFGAHNENSALALWRYENGVYGYQATGLGDADTRNIMGAYNRLVGTGGVIEIEPAGEGMPMLRVKRQGDADWQSIDCEGEHCHGPGYNERAVADVVQCLEDGTTSELCAENALQATEIIFACWESSRRRGLVELPLDIEDNPLEEMVASGALLGGGP